jgi:hypothetical protein
MAMFVTPPLLAGVRLPLKACLSLKIEFEGILRVASRGVEAEIAGLCHNDAKKNDDWVTHRSTRFTSKINTIEFKSAQSFLDAVSHASSRCRVHCRHIS